MKTHIVLGTLANAIVARANCLAKPDATTNPHPWLGHWEATIHHIAKELLPSGSGVDRGTKVDLDRSNGRTLIVLETAFHHMDENGMYDGWTDHTIRIVPDLLFGYTIKIGGRDRNGIKEYLHDVFAAALDAEMPADPGPAGYQPATVSRNEQPE